MIESGERKMGGGDRVGWMGGGGGGSEGCSPASSQQR